MRIGVAEFLKKVGQLKKRDEKVEALKMNNSFVLQTTLQGIFDPRIKFQLPDGDVPYQPNKLPDLENVYIRECRLLKHFVEGGTPGLAQIKRETMFIEFLENVSPADAEMVVLMKDKKHPFKGLNADMVREAFPDLLPPETPKESKTAKANEQNEASA
jgi:hypothetical protein